MSEAIKLIISLSISGSILAGIILSIKPLIKHKLSKSIQYYIWIVVLLRLIIPFSFEASLMNRIFYRDVTPTEAFAPKEIKPAVNAESNGSVSSDDQKTDIVMNEVQQAPGKETVDIKGMVLNNLIYIWLIGALIVLTSNLSGYMKFSGYLNNTSRPASEEESMLLKGMLNGKRRLTLVRSRFAATPMLMGICRPRIIIPDIDFSDSQLKNILCHELTHMRRFDIGIKWLTALAVSIHWFNPIMYFIKKEINHACELSCDEAVINNLNDDGKQEYGETLISVVAEQKYPAGILSATMCEEKKTLKERLISIMRHSKKSRLITLVSAVLLLGVMGTSVVLGAGVGFGSKTPPNIYITTEFGKTKNGITGGYSWRYGNTNINADSEHPRNFKYGPMNIVSVGAGEQMIITTKKIKADKRYDFHLDKIEIFKDNKPVELAYMDNLTYLNSNLYLPAPQEAGEYIYSLELNFGNKGTANYGFIVRVDMATYDLTEIEKYKTPYIGNHSKVMGVVGQLPIPDKGFKQQYISMKTSSKPYKLTVYYEGISETVPGSEWTIRTSGNEINGNMQKNALVLFSMIGNLDEVIFSYRSSPTTDGLDTSKYLQSASYTREGIETLYGNIEELSKSSELLYEALSSKTAPENLPEFSEKDVASARAVVEEYYRAVAAKDDKAILATLHESRKSDNMILYGTEKRTLLKVEYNPQDPVRKNYRPNDDAFAPNKIIVFKVSFNIEYPKGDGGSWNDGVYNNWSMILIREDENSPWLIYDQGY